ncbi:hypothetical protein SAMN04487897_109152 [Paenibacillus sp. yr247]|uniref:hypothetical protein n=1 Tax=Paenibacillus sp. yr247 TaxID=1761880 RepID=UPI000890D0B4|nr:hypothetical protein [Paenibacillus sp. yr247]SDO18882.1 hypothetical protein SAMN04487897_109152 [Paenibacillus sp. yr247]
MQACKLEYTWWKWPADPLEVLKKYFSTIEEALFYADMHLQHYKGWRIVCRGQVICNQMDYIIGNRTLLDRREEVL